MTTFKKDAYTLHTMSIPKSTLSLIAVLGIITVALLYIALSQTTKTPQQSVTNTPTVTTSPAHTMLFLTLAPPSLVTVHMDTGSNTVTAVQLELAYDPNVLTNVTVTKGTFFDQSVELFNKVDARNGRISYAIAIPPTGQPKKGQGIIATISYQRVLGATQQTSISFLPKSKVTEEGVNPSVLQSTTDVIIPALSQ